MENKFKDLINICKDKKFHISLSNNAYNTINEDRIIFSNNGNTITTNYIYNKIFTNFYSTSLTTINYRVNEYIIDLRKVITSNNEESDIIINVLVDNYKNKLINNIKPLLVNKDKAVDIKFSVYNLDTIVNENFECEVYNYKFSRYLKALFEEYARLPLCKREEIFFKDIVDTINLNIELNNMLFISLNDNNKSTFNVLPYKIVPNHSSMYNYVVCVKKTKEGIKLSSIRLSRISEIRRLNRKLVLSREEIKELEDNLKDVDVEYLKGKVEEIKVEFTDLGLMMFRTITHLRPNSYKLDGNICTFDCSEKQALHYLFKFGHEAKIITPAKLRYEFINLYKKALDNYND